MSDSILKNKYFTTFAYFEYRKIIRLLGGEVFEKNTHPFVTTLVILLWFINFLISSIQVQGNKLVFTFYEYPSGAGIVNTALGFTANIIFTQSLILLVIATSWQIRNIVYIFAIVLSISTIFSILVALVRDAHPFGLPLVAYICTFVLCCVTLQYLYYYYFMPSIIVWNFYDTIVINQPIRTSISTIESLNETKDTTTAMPSSSQNEIPQHSTMQVSKNPILLPNSITPSPPSSAVAVNNNHHNNDTSTENPSIYCCQYKHNTQLSKSFFSFPYIPVIAMILFLLVMISFWIPLIIVFILSIILNMIGLTCFEFLPTDMFFRLHPNYWVFQQSNNIEDDSVDTIDKNEDGVNSTTSATIDGQIGSKAETVMYARRAPWWSLSRYFNTTTCNSTNNTTTNTTSCCLNMFTNTATTNGTKNISTTTNPNNKTNLFFQYSGSFNNKNQPHGYGEWKDSDTMGETCGGMFYNGLPIAPYLAREKYGYGIFRNIRIGFVTISAGSKVAIDMSTSFLKKEETLQGKGLYCGVAEVECCVSGTFYRHFPRSHCFSTTNNITDTTTNKSIQNAPTTTSNANTYIAATTTTVAANDIINTDNASSSCLIDMGMSINECWKLLIEPYESLTFNEPITTQISKNNLLFSQKLQLEVNRINDATFEDNDSNYIPSAPIKQSTDISTSKNIVYKHTHPSDTVGRVYTNNNNDNYSNKIQQFQQFQPFITTPAITAPTIATTTTTTTITTTTTTTDQTSSYYKPLIVHVTEAIIFIPGFNSCLEKSLATFGQFYMMSGYPSYITPFLFCWPQGAILSYYQTKDTAESKEFTSRFRCFLLELETVGVTRINIIGHSMGARALLGFFNQIEVINTTVNNKNNSTDLAQVKSSNNGNVIQYDGEERKEESNYIINPNANANANTTTTTTTTATAATTKNVINNITTTTTTGGHSSVWKDTNIEQMEEGQRMNNTLDNTSITNMTKNLPPSIPPQMAQIPLSSQLSSSSSLTQPVLSAQIPYDIECFPSLGNIILINPEADLTSFYSAYHHSMHALSESITIYTDTTDNALFWSSRFNHIQEFCSRNTTFSWSNRSIPLGRTVNKLMNNLNPNEVLDVDIINAGLITGKFRLVN